jgi:hypothetical protein
VIGVLYDDSQSRIWSVSSHSFMVIKDRGNTLIFHSRHLHIDVKLI